MRLLECEHGRVRWFERAWEAFIEPASTGDARERHLARLLNVILLGLLVWGMLYEIRSLWENRFSDLADFVRLLIVSMLAVAYYLNRQGRFGTAIVLTVGLLIASTFAAVLLRNVSAGTDLSILYYLIVAVLLSDLFFSIRGYLITTALILGGVFAISLLNPSAEAILLFLTVFCVLVGFSSYSRRFIEKEQLSLAASYARERSLLSMEQRRAAQLSLLEEAGRKITESLEEREVLQHTLEAVVSSLGYAQVIISLLVDQDTLEIAAISDNADPGYRRGFRQELGKGIIGHVAQSQQAYIAGEVLANPYDFSSAPRSGSSAAVPMLDKGQLLGVLYVESIAQDAIRPEDLQALQTVANQVATSLQKARLYARTQEHLQVMTALQSISQVITSSLELNQILNSVIQLLRDSFGYTYIGVYLLEGDVLHLGAQLGYPKDMLIPHIPITAGVIGRTARLKKTQFLSDVTTDPDFLREAYEVRSEIAVPLMKDEHVLGVLNVEAENSAMLDEYDINLLNALAGSIAVAIDNARLHAEVKLMAMTDVVSGLANRRAFDDFLASEMTRASRYNHIVSLIILDLDSFKEYNDKWGHPAGDIRLREIADLLRANVREPDLAARYGGEEFAVILPDTSKSGAIRLAERLRRAAAASAPHQNRDGGPISGYTISLGVATYPEDAASIKELLLAADNAELTAKRLGKNRVYATDISADIQDT